MKNVNEALLSYQSIRKAVYIGSTLNTAGRSGEATYMYFDEEYYWDYDDEKLYFHQKEMKLGRRKTTISYRMRNLMLSINTGSSVSITSLVEDLISRILTNPTFIFFPRVI